MTQEWWNKDAPVISPVLSSAIVHYRFETVHPFADGNGRAGRALALWELYRRRFDSHHLFAVDEFYWEDRPRYYSALDAVRREGDDLTTWLEYYAEGLQQTLERMWERMEQFSERKDSRSVSVCPSYFHWPLGTGIFSGSDHRSQHSVGRRIPDTADGGRGEGQAGRAPRRLLRHRQCTGRTRNRGGRVIVFPPHPATMAA